VLDLYSGNTQKGEPFSSKHVSTVQSITKVITGLAIAMLEDRGLLQYDEPIAKYWPSFGTNGKETITVAELLSHTAGLYKLSSAKGLKFFHDRDAIAPFLEEQSPSRRGEIVYSMVTVGLIASQLIKRVDTKSRYLHEFCRDEIFAPLGIEDVAAMMAPSDDFIAEKYCRHPTYPSDGLRAILPDSLQETLLGGRTLTGPERAALRSTFSRPDVYYSNMFCLDWRPLLLLMDDPDWLKSENGSATLLTNASALGVVADELSRGGGRLLSSEALGRAAAVASDGFDQTFAVPANFSNCGWSRLGRYSSSDTVRAAAEEGMCGWWGLGGSLMQFCPSRHFGFAFQTTHVGLGVAPAIPAFDVLDAALKCASEVK